MNVGTITSIRRYPVKSMQGEEINIADVSDRGVLGDRAYALIDRATGHIASAKHPRKWSRLLACHAGFVKPPQLGKPLPPVSIMLPDGDVICSTQPDVDQVLSRVLEREVTLLAEAPSNPTREADRTPLAEAPSNPTREADRTPIDGASLPEAIREERVAFAAPNGTFFDYAPLHILTTATLERRLCRKKF
ncbi:MOSC N-terminal beta barrel domain-containing protein [Phormidium tenue FACHB-886]|nr:MOSC N-terminal beta barrel domain-containing protein [Phormidium tenue FACHB-886]